jgi:beta-N-acetylhexosaminidase
MRSHSVFLLLVLGLAGLVSGQTAQPALDREAQRWIDGVIKTMTLEEKVGQVLMPSFESTYLPTDSDAFRRLTEYVRSYHVGGFIVFGASQSAPAVALNPTYASVILGHPLAAATTINRLQRLSKLPLLTAADFETGVGMRMAGGTQFPRAMAFGATGDPALAERAGLATAREGRALGIHVNFAPVADVNNNARNPVINTRSFGERPASGGAGSVPDMVSAYVRGLQRGGMLATLKHFPGHGDTDVDSHIGLPVVPHARERLDAIELPPFRAGTAAGAGAVMTAHISMPSIDPSGVPVTFSERAVGGLLRRDLGFDGLVFTDSMTMHAVTKMASPGDGAVRAFLAGHDMVLHTPDVGAAHEALLAAARSGKIPMERLEESLRRILSAKARLGLHRARLIDVEKVPDVVGTREHRGIAREVSERSVTLLKDEHGALPLRLPADASVLYLSVLDYPSGWGIAAPARTFLPELRRRWPNVTAIELSDRSTPNEIDLVRASAARYDAIVVSIAVRTASFSGRMDLSPAIVGLLKGLVPLASAGAGGGQARGEGEEEMNRPLQEGARGARKPIPLVTVFFGNPYQATFVPELPAVLLTYDFYDLAEATAVRALSGEIPMSGRLPISLPGLFEAGHGLERARPQGTM